MVLIYHGCFTKNADSTNKLIGPGEKCLTLTAQCFWKDPKDVHSGVKTCSRWTNQPTMSTILKKSNLQSNGFQAQKSILRKHLTRSLLSNFHCYALVYHS